MRVTVPPILYMIMHMSMLMRVPVIPTMPGMIVGMLFFRPMSVRT